MTAPESAAAPGQPYGAVSASQPPQPSDREPAEPLGYPRPAVPPVLPGPGVRPPFAAPPVRKEAGTLALGMIIGGLVLLLCLVGGGVVLGGTVISAMRETEQQATATAAEYLDAIVDQRYADAYQMTCRSFRKKVDEQEYVTTKQRGEQLVGYELQPIASTRAGKLVVPATLRRVSGPPDTVALVMAWETVEGSDDGVDDELRVRVCGEVANPVPAPS